MKRITKTYKTLTQAERYQNRLYNQYDYVRLVSAPRFGEDGVYTWEVRGKLDEKEAKVARTDTEGIFGSATKE